MTKNEFPGVDKGIPIPDPQRFNTKTKRSFLRGFAVGDSAELPVSEIGSYRTNAHNLKIEDFEFVIRKISPKTFRIWRIK